MGKFYLLVETINILKYPLSYSTYSSAVDPDSA
jgi:hypothetical protein